MSIDFKLSPEVEEVRLQTISRNLLKTYAEHGSTRLATGDLL